MKPFVRPFARGAFALAAFTSIAVAGLCGATARDASASRPLFSLHRASPSAGKLQHLIFIVQENRSFDHYFGTFPGADGFPSPLPCLPDEWHPHYCDPPYLDHADNNNGGYHTHQWQQLEENRGLMNGFVISKEDQVGRRCHIPGATLPAESAGDDDEGFASPDIKKCTVDVMGYHDGTDIPNYWSYASNFVLEDHFFESVLSWSNPSHLMLFSGWSADCSNARPYDPGTCRSSFNGGTWEPTGSPVVDLWTDITYLLHQNGVSWRVYLDGGQGATGTHTSVPTIWNVLPGFETVRQDGQIGDATHLLGDYFEDAAAGTLPAVSWIFPNYHDSEHPQASVLQGQAYVTSLINAAMRSSDWTSTAIFISWDDIDGFYDHEPPPYTFSDGLGLGMRVPAMIVSPYAKTGYIDRQLCSTDCYLDFIEDTLLGGERIRDAGRPDPRPLYRDEQTSIYGNLNDDFNFNQAPRPPLILRPHPMSLLRTDLNPNTQPPLRALR